MLGCERRVQACAFSASPAKVENLNQIWQEAVRRPPREGAPSSAQAEVSFYASLLQRSVHRLALPDGKRAHFHIVSLGLDQNALLSNLLVQMYGYCGSLQDARVSFSRMPLHDAFSWSFLIRSYTRYACLDQALCLFVRMQSEGFLPDNPIIGSLITACAGKDELSIVRLIHAFIVDSSLTPTVFVSTALLSIYGKLGCPQDAKAVFEELQERDAVCWNAMIASYVSEKENTKAICLYHRMNAEGVKPAKPTFLSILSACAGLRDIVEGRLVHNCVFESGFELDVGIANSLVNMYGDCDSLEDAQTVFDQISGMDVVSWNTMIAGLVRNGRDEDALLLFERMQREAVTPSNVTFINVLSACISPKVLEQGQLLHHFVICLGSESDVVIANSLVNMYGKSGGMKDARVMFEKSQNRDRVSWTAMLTACAQFGQDQEVSQLFEQMQQEGIVPDRVTFVSISVAFTNETVLHKCKQIHARILSIDFVTDVNLDNSLVTMYGKCGCTECAMKVFEKMPKRDLMSWNAIFTAYAQNGLGMEALRLLNTMGHENVFPDKFLCSSILSACASTATEDKGKEMHTFVVINGFEADLTLGNAILNMYGKFGNLEDAFRVFERMPKRDIVSWSAVIGAFAQQGEGKTAVNLYNKMLQEGVASDRIALVHLLSACSHDGLVDEGLRHFLSLAQENDGELIVDHFNCMVDLLGRAGRLEEAEKLLLKLPLKSSAVAWTTLLGACRSQVDVKRGEYAANRVFELDPEDAAPYVTLSNLYFAAGKVDDALQVIKRMREMGLVKQIDNMPIDVLGGVHNFSSEGTFACT
eukprot:c33129_g1_i1 orf=22-2463(+)